MSESIKQLEHITHSVKQTSAQLPPLVQELVKATQEQIKNCQELSSDIKKSKQPLPRRAPPRLPPGF